MQYFAQISTKMETKSNGRIIQRNNNLILSGMDSETLKDATSLMS